MAAAAASAGHQFSRERGYKLRVPQGCGSPVVCDEMSEVALIRKQVLVIDAAIRSL